MDTSETQSETARRCFALIEKHAPILMRAGGGGLGAGKGREYRRVKEPKPPTEITPEMEQFMIKEYGSHGNITQISRDLGVAVATVHRRLVKLGVWRRRVG